MRLYVNLFLLIIFFIVGKNIVLAQNTTNSLKWNTDAYEKHWYVNATNDSMPYRLLKPNNFDPNLKYPLVIALHGKDQGIGGTCSVKNGPNICNLSWGGQMHLDSIDRHPSFVVFPQTTLNDMWSNGDYTSPPAKPMKLLIGVITEIINNYNIDLNRVYIHGLSAGGAGTWEILYRYPHLFAAATPSSAYGNASKAVNYVCNPLWNVQGSGDGSPAYAYRVMDTLNKHGRPPINTYDPVKGIQNWPQSNSTNGRPIFTLVPNTGHEAWPAIYASPTWLSWMFTQNKLNITVFGEKKIYAGDSLKLAISPGFDAYQWSNGATTNQIFVKQSGDNQVRFMRKAAFFSGPSVWSDWSPVVTIKPGIKDDISPSSPGNLISPIHTHNTITLSWTPATDNMGVAGYQLFLNGKLYDTTTVNNYTVKNLQPVSSYQFSVKAIDSTGNLSPLSNLLTVTTNQAVNGLIYSYYEGTWSAIPDYNSLIAKASGYIENFLLTPVQKPTYYAISYEGFIDVPVDGPYTFYTKSDDGSRLSINGNVIVNNDGLHGTLEKSGIVTLTKGRYPIKSSYLQNTGNAIFEVRYAGPGIPKQLIPNTSLYLTNVITNNTIDTIAPTNPTSLVSIGKSLNSVSLQWNASIDNVGVIGYDLYLNGTYTMFTNTTSATIINLSPSTAYSFYVKAKDSTGNISRSSNILNVTTDTNHNPILASVTNQNVNKGSILNVAVSATDIDGDTISLISHGLPAFGSFIDNHNGTGSFRFAPLSTDSGSYFITVKATDIKGGADSLTFTIKVNSLSFQGKTLFRINTGGYPLPATGNSSLIWEQDNYKYPSQYVNSSISGNKTGSVTDNIVLLPLVPAGTPMKMFQTERSISTGNVLQYNLPVAKGSKVEVRLYFAEIYFTAANKRRFNISIEDTIRLSNYDIFAEVGYEVGTMKSYVTTSDGILNISFIKVLQNPKIHGIEVVCLDDFCNSNNTSLTKMASLMSTECETSNFISAYPNPFVNSVLVRVSKEEMEDGLIKIYNNLGEAFKEYTIGTNMELNLDLSYYPNGIYYLKIYTQSGELKQSLRLMKY